MVYLVVQLFRSQEGILCVTKPPDIYKFCIEYLQLIWSAEAGLVRVEHCVTKTGLKCFVIPPPKKKEKCLQM